MLKRKEKIMIREEMKTITSDELRKMYTQFFRQRDHQEISSASLLPENDPSVLFTTAGMHPLVPYLLGEKHPLGTRLVNYQKCIRTGDIDEVGDTTHLTFFEMLGNWSLGDYFKKESITMSFTFLTEILHIPMNQLAVTIFEGDDIVPKDVESKQAWISLGLNENQIFYYGRKENWWGPAGQTGPCGSDTEIFFDTGIEKCHESCGPACNCGKYIEIWNNVFLEYNKNEDGSYTKLKQKNVDTGMGLERVLAVLNQKNSVYDTDVLKPIIDKIESLTGFQYDDKTNRDYRIIADHIRAATFILGDKKGIVPSNSEQGYIVRRLIRRTIRLMKKYNISQDFFFEITELIIGMNKEIYPELMENRTFIQSQLEKEYIIFNKTIDMGLKKAEKYISNVLGADILSGEIAFKLFDTYGFPVEFTQELANEKGIRVDMNEFDEKFKEHQEKSRLGAEVKFKGGLADHSDRTTKLHTATHLLNGALRTVLGPEIFQKGSNITADRLRFDFSFGRKLTNEELEQVNFLVNKAISENIPVVCEEMSVSKAKEQGAIGVFDSKYQEKVKVYSVKGFSKEICGGPHVNNTSELKHFIILKEESSSAGVRRIKATIKD
ncbi:MAG: Alanine--tRNA ligase [Anaerocolumna sp.]|jgi:alanyl-tRNA synthetase|nr:Alanine--tRNA ligase [Anaerocolumna sp.]